jgi:hypothetical protein
VIKFVAALAGQNGLRALGGEVEELALAMAVEHGRRLWFEGDLTRDYVTFREALGPFAYAWDDPALYIDEVYIDGEPRLARARELVEQSEARAIMARLREQAVAPEKLARAERWMAALAAQAIGR